MTMPALTLSVFLLVAFSSLCHASWNAIIRQHGGVAVTLVMSCVTIVCGLVLALISGSVSSAALPILIASCGVHILSRFLVNISYRTGDMSQIYPVLRGAVPVFTGILSIAFTNDTMSINRMLLLLIVAIGIGTLALRGGRIAARIETRSVGAALLTALCAAGYTLLDGIGARLAGDALAFSAWIFIVDGFGSLGLSYVLLRRQGSRVQKLDLTSGLSAGLLQTVSFGVVIVAMTQAPIVLVAATREMSLVFGVLLSVLILKEPQTKWRLGGAALITAAMILLQVEGQFHL
jgi:drug/metabolite transporter (DMT)-like permease